MQTRYPNAAWRPLGPVTDEPRITPRILVFHTMVGYLKSVDSMFRSGGFSGVESTFGVGGPWDGADLDGAVWQWQDIGYQADAQAAGNAYCDSIETSDGGDPSRPWSTKQLQSLTALTVWWCRQTGNPAQMVRSTSDRGIGYHRQFRAWNPNAHSCPGNARLAQLLDIIIPAAARALAGQPTEVDVPLTPQEIAAVADAVWAHSIGGVGSDSTVQTAEKWVATAVHDVKVLQAKLDQPSEPVTVDVPSLAAALAPYLSAGVDAADVAHRVLAGLHDALGSLP